MKSIEKLRRTITEIDMRGRTDENGVITVYMSKGERRTLENTADEIEAEIADMQAFCERVEKAAENSDELDVFGVSYMALPVDADGVPIHVGDVMMDGKTPRYAVAVAPESFMMDGYETGSFYRPGLAKNYHHVKPRTLEDVLIDMLETAVGYSDAHTDVALVAVESYADEIRELLGGDA